MQEIPGFLLKEKKDPLEDLIKSMLSLLGKKGSIVAYNAGFEKGCIKSLVKSFPKYSSDLRALTERFNDLMVPFRSGHYIHYKSHGSHGLKAILPALTSHSYDDLEIKEGGAASNMYGYWINNMMEQKE